MASNETKIILTAEDKTTAAFSAATRNLQSMQGAAALASGALAAIGVSFSGAAAVAMIKGTIDAADGFNDLAQKVGIGVRQLAGWTLAANQSGTSMESVAKGIKSLSTYMVDNSEKMRAAGITATDANGAMTQLADLFAAMPDGVEKTALAVKLFGKAGMDMIPMLNMGSQGLAEAQEKADAYGKKMAELAPQADKFNDQMEELALHSKALGINIASYVVEPMTAMAKAFNEAAASGNAFEKSIEFLAKSGHPVFGSIKIIGRALDAAGFGVERSKGYSGPKNAAGLSMSEEEAFDAATNAYMAQRGARGRAAGLQGGGGGGGSGSRALTPLQRALAEQEKRLAAMNSGFDEQTVSVETVTRQYEKALEDRAAAMDAAHEARMEQQRIEMEGEGAIQAWIDKGTESLQKQKSVADELGMTFASAAESAILKWESARDVLQALGEDVARIFLRKNFTEPLAGAASKFFDGFDPFGLKANASGGVYDSPSLSAYSGGVYDSPRLFAFANGAGVFGEAGPEAIMPLRRGADGKLGVSGGGTTVVINNYSSAKTTQTERTGANGARELVVMIEDVVTGMMGAGALDGAMRQNFGARRQGVLRG